MADGQAAAAVERQATQQAAPKESPLDKLNPRGRQLVQDTLQAYPELTVEEAVEALKAFGGL